MSTFNIFITALETLANKKKKMKNINGIKIDNKEMKISLLADDIRLIHSELECIKVTIRILKSFEICAGVKRQHGPFYHKYFINAPSLTFGSAEIMFYHQN